MAALAVQMPALLCAFLACAASGAAGAASLLEIVGRGRRAQTPLAVASLVLAVAAVAAMLFKFQRPDRLFNAFSHLSSALSQALVACLVLVALTAALVAVLRRGAGIGRPLAFATIAAGVLVAVASARNVAITSFNGAEKAVLCAYFVALVVELGALGVWVASAARGDAVLAPLGARAVLVCAAVQAVCYAAWLAVRGLAPSASLGDYLDPTQITSGVVTKGAGVVELVLTGGLSGWFWLGAVALGVAAVAALCIFFGRVTRAATKAGLGAAVACVVCAAAGSVSFQAVFALSLSMAKVSVFG